jgi:hypothetical protein
MITGGLWTGLGPTKPVDQRRAGPQTAGVLFRIAPPDLSLARRPGSNRSTSTWIPCTRCEYRQPESTREGENAPSAGSTSGQRFVDAGCATSDSRASRPVRRARNARRHPIPHTPPPTRVAGWWGSARCVSTAEELIRPSLFRERSLDSEPGLSQFS